MDRNTGRWNYAFNGKVLGPPYDCYNPERIAGTLVTFGTISLNVAKNHIVLGVVGKAPESTGYKIGIDSYQIRHDSPYIKTYLVLGPFPKADINAIDEPLRPEIALDFEETFDGIEGETIRWQEATTEADGFLDLRKNISVDPIVVGYAFTYVYTPKATESVLLLGSDDGITVWLNGTEIHRNDVLRQAIPDEDVIPCQLKMGWNTVLCKIGQDHMGWGLYMRFADADGVLKYSTHSVE